MCTGKHRRKHTLDHTWQTNLLTCRTILEQLQKNDSRNVSASIGNSDYYVNVLHSSRQA